MLKPINGTWFEFWHHNRPEGKYWNPICRKFTDEQWREKVREIKSLNMSYIVLMCTSLVYEDHAESYFNSGIYDFPKDMTCKNPIEVLLDECDKQDIKVFMSVGFYGNWEKTIDNITSPEVKERAFKAIDIIWKEFGHHKSLYGWYYPDETEVNGHFDERFIKYVNEYSAYAKQYDATKKILVAPYGTNKVVCDDLYVEQLKRIDADFIAYQDEIGVEKSFPDETAAYYKALKQAHDRAGKAKLWADMEVFKFEGTVYDSALLPAKMARIKKQLESISPYVDEVLIYQYIGLMNKPGTTAYCGFPESIKLYDDYKKFLEENK